MGFENILFEQQGRVAILTINRPDKRNVLNKATRLEIAAVIDQVAADPGVGVLVITGAGEESFIAGSDLNEFGRMTPLEAYEFLDTLAQRLYTRFEELDKPVIARINGLCLGAGSEIALACDIRLAADTARFGQPEINLGIMPGSGGTQRLPRLVGPGPARELIFTGRIIDAAEAWRIGLVNHVYPPAELRDQTMALAEAIAAKSAFSLKMAKRAMRLGQEVGVTPGLAYEALAEVACFCTPEKEEGVNAFFAKRRPKFHPDDG
ncbi:MAG: enoyl-CoA hydratase/isomerase family protein [Proteobacteria bacterium]|nr:enoyl-CoA hydratase/isomerase family protein [Pseudomonadota bacterium]MBU1741959.1 enoyl-CoA hydratase/isomerase family protein [Pseudomonadota bacterium]